MRRWSRCGGGLEAAGPEPASRLDQPVQQHEQDVDHVRLHVRAPPLADWPSRFRPGTAS